MKNEGTIALIENVIFGGIMLVASLPVFK